MAFNLKSLEKKLFELRAAVEKALVELRIKPKTAPAPSKTKRKKRAAAPKPDALAELLAALDAHPKKAALVKAGKQKDQLLRSLIPFYLARDIDITSGTTSRFWAKHGVTYAAPNAAKALRLHPGHVARTAKGARITPRGISYVEAALKTSKK